MKPKTIKACINCKHWQGEKNLNPDLPLLPLDDEIRNGICKELKYHLDIDLKTGWSGAYVEDIYTLASFHCACYIEQPRETHENES